MRNLIPEKMSLHITNRHVLLMAAALSFVSVAQGVKGEEASLQVSGESTREIAEGDTLWDIANSFLGNPTRWPEIWNLNKEIIKNPDLIYPGQKINLTEAGNRVAEASKPMPQKEESVPNEAAAPEKTPKKITEEPAALPPPAEKEPIMPTATTENPILVEIGKVVSAERKGKRSGYVRHSTSGKEISEPGDEIAVQYDKSLWLSPGTMLTIHREKEFLIDPKGEFADEQEHLRILETIGAAELTEVLSAGKGLAKILTASEAIEAGDSLYVWRGSPQ